MGIAASAPEVATSAAPTARMLADRGCRSAFVIGEAGIRLALTDAGIEVRAGDATEVDAVVVGLDRTADYAALRHASILVDRGAAFVGTNADASFPAADGARWPGAGALIAAIATTTGAVAEIVGKPNAPLYLDALERAGGGVPLVIGDRLDTDIAGAAALGWDSLLVLTGITRREDLDGSPGTADPRVRGPVDPDPPVADRPGAAAEGRAWRGGILMQHLPPEGTAMNADDVRKMLDYRVRQDVARRRPRSWRRDWSARIGGSRRRSWPAIWWSPRSAIATASRS